MYPITPEILKLYKENYRQVVNIICRRDGVIVRELTESDILQGGLEIDRYCVSGDTIEIGTATAAELKVQLDNRDDRFANERFEGMELEVKIGIKKWDAYKWEKAQIHWIPCGFFIVDEPPRKLSKITLTALDKMVNFDVVANPYKLPFPMSVNTLLKKCCELCGVELSPSVSLSDEENDIISDFIGANEENLTYRQLILWIAERTGTCAYIDWEGKLRFEWYHDTDGELTPSERYSSELYEQDITVTGVQITDENVKILAGTDEYAFNIESNQTISSTTAQSVADRICAKVAGFTYRPMSCTCKAFPHFYPLDKIKFIDKHGTAHDCIVTNITFKMNAQTKIEGKGKTNVEYRRAKANPISKAEAIVLKKLENRVYEKIGNYEKSALDMNELISNSLGLYRTIITKQNGGVAYYYHDGSTLQNSTIIYTFGANGFAWTDKWQGDDTVWTNGITKEGNAILRSVSALSITADSLKVEDADDNTLFFAENNTVQIANFTVTKNTLENITKVYPEENNSEVYYENGVRVANDRIEVMEDTYSITLQKGKLSITTDRYYDSNSGLEYFLLMEFFQPVIGENNTRVPTSESNRFRLYVANDSRYPDDWFIKILPANQSIVQPTTPPGGGDMWV